MINNKELFITKQKVINNSDILEIYRGTWLNDEKSGKGLLTFKDGR